VGVLMCFAAPALIWGGMHDGVTLRRVHVDAGKTLCQYDTGLIEGTNMFTIDIRKARGFQRVCPIVGGWISRACFPVR
jgi:hypothetical protein